VEVRQKDDTKHLPPTRTTVRYLSTAYKMWVRSLKIGSSCLCWLSARCLWRFALIKTLESPSRTAPLSISVAAGRQNLAMVSNLCFYVVISARVHLV
jgi:hypothetical protein